MRGERMRNQGSGEESVNNDRWGLRQRARAAILVGYCRRAYHKWLLMDAARAVVCGHFYREDEGCYATARLIDRASCQKGTPTLIVGIRQLSLLFQHTGLAGHTYFLCRLCHVQPSAPFRYDLNDEQWTQCMQSDIVVQQVKMLMHTTLQRRGTATALQGAQGCQMCYSYLVQLSGLSRQVTLCIMHIAP